MIIRASEYDITSHLKSLSFTKRKKGQRRKAFEREILNDVTAFDIETTTLDFPLKDGEKHNSHAFMYIWQWAVDTDLTVIGRTWDEFLEFTRKIADFCEIKKNELGLKEKPLYIVWVHNLAFEFQFMSGIYKFENEDCFFRKPRKPLYCRMYNAIEFRCSYAHSNMSLEKFAENMQTHHRKQSGAEFDYKKTRYPWTELSDKELEYCVCDVQSLRDSIINEMALDGDNLYTIPLTSTGYVRRDCKKALFFKRAEIKKLIPTLDQYKLLRKTMRGGNTHANRFFVGKILENVRSKDKVSSYPAQQLTELFPMTPFQDIEGELTLKRIMKFINFGDAVVAEYEFANLELKNKNEPIPYLSLSKTESVNFKIDNGRILRAEYCRTALTEIDLMIVLDTYKFTDINIISAMKAKKAPLPQEYRAVIMDYYRGKTELKGVLGMEYEYGKKKNKVNAIFGMSATDPIHQIITYYPEGNENEELFALSDYNDRDAEERLEKSAFPYQWGVYTTAYGRLALQIGIKATGANVVYVDTDSVKYIGDVDFTAINDTLLEKARKTGAYADDKNGETHFIGIFEDETPYDLFITQGAKRYAFKKAGKSEIDITVAGLTYAKNPDTGRRYAVEELENAGGLSAFKPGMKWHKGGGTAALYNDYDDFYFNAEGREIHITRNVAIVESAYELTHSDDYELLLSELILYKEWSKANE